MKLFLGGVAGIFFCFLASLPARAAFEDAFYSARSAAMGGAMTAISDDSASLFYNPAGLGQIRNPQVGANYLNAKNSPSGAAKKKFHGFLYDGKILRYYFVRTERE